MLSETDRLIGTIIQLRLKGHFDCLNNKFDCNQNKMHKIRKLEQIQPGSLSPNLYMIWFKLALSTNERRSSYLTKFLGNLPLFEMFL